MEDFIARTRDKRGACESDPIFNVTGLKRLTCDHLKQSMRAVAECLGLPADRISAHSLRYGGATLMSSAGFPEFIIAQYGGWVEGSESLKIYIKPTFKTIDSVSRHMASGGNSDAEQELLLHIKNMHQMYAQSITGGL
jgi:integrase